MVDTFKKLYEDIGNRKSKPEDLLSYRGGNGRVDRAANLIRFGKFPSSGVLVDVGGAIGDLGASLADLFTERWVLDIYEGHKSAANRKGNHFVTCNVDRDGLLGIEDGSADIVAALDFIEHILNPEKFARECWRALKPGGSVLINTPNIQYWRHLHSLAVEGIFPHTSGDREVYHGGHVAFFNLKDMEKIFGEAGFVGLVMRTEGLIADPPPPLWISIAAYSDHKQLMYPDLIVSCKKPE